MTYKQRQKVSLPILWLTNRTKIHQKSLVLTLNGSLLLPRDAFTFEDNGMTVLDCSWKQNDEILRQFFRNARKLPKLLAGNPVNYGRWEFLTSMEAASAALFIMGFERECSEILATLTWGDSFWKLNQELLRGYQSLTDEESYLRILSEFT